MIFGIAIGLVAAWALAVAVFIGMDPRRVMWGLTWRVQDWWRSRHRRRAQYRGWLQRERAVRRHGKPTVRS